MISSPGFRITGSSHRVVFLAVMVVTGGRWFVQRLGQAPVSVLTVRIVALPGQVAEATKQATAMQASLTKLQADKDGLKRDVATVYARMKASESQTAAVRQL